jgi:hypothetical protein
MVMEQLFGGGFDLAAVASAAGLGGSAIGAVGALVFFKGFVMRVLSQVVVTAALTGVGFLALLNVLGFQITPKPPVAAAEMVAPSGAENFSVQSVPTAPPPEEGVTKTFYVQSPFRKS